MSALPADIVRATRQARIVRRTDAAIQSAFVKARDQGDDPQAGYFQNAADASAALEAQAALIGTFRRRFSARLAEPVWIDPLTEVPTWHLTDSETDMDDDVIVTRIEIDLEEETTLVEVIG